MLIHNKTLTLLNLGLCEYNKVENNNIRDEGANYIAESLIVNKALNILILSIRFT